MTYRSIMQQLKRLGDSDKAAHAQRFFKTGPGEYGEGDRFLGIRVPPLRQLARQHRSLAIDECEQLLHSEWHEARLLALLILVGQFQHAEPAEQRLIYRFYLANTKHINSWDLVDTSAHPIIGGWLSERSRKPLHKLARSKLLWERRIAMMATYHFIKRNDFDETLQLAEKLLADPEDLIHKVVGWMLREIGKRDQQTELRFLRKHHLQMPRTMLRYAIEKFPPTERKQILAG